MKEKKPKAKTINASSINWDNTKTPKNLRVDFSNAAKKTMEDNNVGHHSFVEYVGQMKSGDDQNWHKFQVSMDSTGKVLIGTNDQVARPCPDFCTTFEDEFEEMISKLIQIEKRLNVAIQKLN